jgi:hypothetical protein
VDHAKPELILVSREDAKTPRFSCGDPLTIRSMLPIHLNGGIHQYLAYLIKMSRLASSGVSTSGTLDRPIRRLQPQHLSDVVQ